MSEKKRTYSVGDLIVLYDDINIGAGDDPITFEQGTEFTIIRVNAESIVVEYDDGYNAEVRFKLDFDFDEYHLQGQ